MIKAISHWWSRTVGMDYRERNIFLTILSSQLRHGRTYDEVFRSLKKSRNRNYAKLARLASDSNQSHFAAKFERYFGKRDTMLLKMAQEYNVVPEVVTDLLVRKGVGISVAEAVWKKNATEWVMMVFLIAVAVLFYVIGADAAMIVVDLTGSMLYRVGGVLYEYSIIWLLFIFSAVFMYLSVRSAHGAVRTAMQKLGMFKFNDALYAIELFRVIDVMTRQKKGGSISMTRLTAELEPLFTETELRQRQFSIIRNRLRQGMTFGDALGKAEILPSQEYELFRGLSGDQTIEQINKASQAVITQLSEQTKMQLAQFRWNVKIALMVLIAVGIGVTVELWISAAEELLQQRPVL